MIRSERLLFRISGLKGVFVNIIMASQENIQEESLDYTQTALICAALIRMPHNPNTVPGNLFYQFLFTLIQ